ncbi:hypothetical protein [Streptomyces acidiscabies]|uniref:DUF2304 domain-containing protein n=1 Tax=Streptomyces acidiscabies TaxID=42234 RepID=A0AAP6BKX9_9ACTN|nr:hypothetical protein [Streptomyces acidiscabies]MBZ3918129.1 hypothetical protein [Streptomyces acidiscabies]MDX2966473.1 hypothetical protein [Streptomyces acidiscabies]MDX3796419.1 hypothetical protein [Streptomyces acidiscabies]
MAVSLSAVVLLAIVVFVLLRNGALRVLPALAAIGFGFFLASTGVAGPINSAAGGLADLLARINF